MATEAENSSISTVAVTSRPPRACDVCGTRRALWYCAADEAHLCTACDTQVHSANAVSLRHERVRLSANGTPKKFAASHLVPVDAQAASRKRARGTNRPYSHHLRKLTRLSNHLASRDVPVEETKHAKLELFDFLDADEFLNDGNQEVPSLDGAKSSPFCSSSDLEFISSDDQEEDESHHSADSFAACFKSKAAHYSQEGFASDVDQFRVPDAAFDHVDATSAPVPIDTDVDLAAENDAFFLPGDIPGLEVGFGSFVPEMDLVDDFALSFDLALQNSLDAFEGNNGPGAATSDVKGVTTQECKTNPPEATQAPHRDFLAGPFAKFFAQKPRIDSPELPMGPERVKREAREMLQCCREGEDEAQKLMPSLQLNFKDILAAWSDREEPWILPGSIHASDDSTFSGRGDTGLVPDMDGDRDARVLRYKEKRRTRLFSKTIRYEVRKLNAERRPRMKGRFVKRTSSSPPARGLSGDRASSLLDFKFAS